MRERIVVKSVDESMLACRDTPVIGAADADVGDDEMTVIRPTPVMTTDCSEAITQVIGHS